MDLKELNKKYNRLKSLEKREKNFILFFKKVEHMKERISIVLASLALACSFLVVMLFSGTFVEDTFLEPVIGVAVVYPLIILIGRFIGKIDDSPRINDLYIKNEKEMKETIELLELNENNIDEQYNQVIKYTQLGEIKSFNSCFIKNIVDYKEKQLNKKLSDELAGSEESELISRLAMIERTEEAMVLIKERSCVMENN